MKSKCWEKEFDKKFSGLGMSKFFNRPIIHDEGGEEVSLQDIKKFIQKLLEKP